VLPGRRLAIALVAAVSATGALLAGGARAAPRDAASSPAPAVPAASCRPWAARTLASGLGALENLEPLPDGRLLMSMAAQGRIGALWSDGSVQTLVRGVRAPGGLRARGPVLYFTTGDAAASGEGGLRDGTIGRVDLDGAHRTTWASGLTMPNGLVFLPSGDAVVSRDLGTGTGLTRVPRRAPRRPQPNWARLGDSNGLAIDRTGTWLYTVETFGPAARVLRLRIADPRRVGVVARLGAPGRFKGLDDMTISRGGTLFVAANGSGEVIRVDPRTGRSCVIARGLTNPSAVKFGCGGRRPSDRLFVTSFDGTVRELRPPPGTRAARGTCVAL
jgi:hypothetical protein